MFNAYFWTAERFGTAEANVTVWNQPSDDFRDDERVTIINGVQTLRDVVEALGDAGYLVISDWTDVIVNSANNVSHDLGIKKAELERIEEWDARNGIASRHAPDSELFTPCPDCGSMIRTAFDRGWKIHFDYCQSHIDRMEREEINDTQPRIIIYENGYTD